MCPFEFQAYEESTKNVTMHETVEPPAGILSDRCRMCGLVKYKMTKINSFDGPMQGLKNKLEWLLNEEVTSY